MSAFARCTEPFVISTEPPVLTQPCEGPLHDPAPGQHAAKYFRRRRQAFPREPYAPPVTPITVWHPFTSCLWWMPNNLHIPAELRLDPTLPTSRVALVDPQMPDARKLLVSAFQQQRHGSAILNIRRVHPGSKNQATRIDQDMAFAPIDTFGTVVAADAADTGGSNRLTVDDASTRLRVASSTRAELLAEDSVQVLPRAIQTP